MPKKYSRRSMKGGWDFTSGWNSFKDWGSGAWGKLTSSTPTSTPSYTPTSNYNGTYDASYNGTTNGYNGYNGYNGTTGYGGKKRRPQSKKMRGGNFTDNTPTTGLAFHAAPFSGETARPNTWVGGKTKKRRKRAKSCRKR